jgi:hypothetical protein
MNFPGCWQRISLAALAVFLLSPLARGQGKEGAKPAQKGEKQANNAAQKAFALQVNAAIDKGAKYLRGLQQADGSWPRKQKMGMTAFAALALLESGYAPNDPAITKAANYVRTWCVAETGVYSLTTAILFLDRLGDPQDIPLIQALGVRLLAGQNQQRESGGWSYHTPAPTADEIKRLQAIVQNRKPGAAPAVPPKGEGPKQLTEKDLAKELRDQIALLNGGTGFNDKLGVDLSNTQFALVALWVARRHGVPVERAYALAEERLRRTQHPAGTWAYLQFDSGNPRALGNFVHYCSPTAQMTCAGLMGLAMAHGISENDKKPKREMSKDPSILKALKAILPIVGTPTGNLAKVPKLAPGQEQQAYYALWTLERAVVLFDLQKVEGKDWYHWGAEVLLANQQADGSWKGAHHEGGADTCFALLFLKRSNFAADLTVRIKKNPRTKELLQGITGGEKIKSDLDSPPKKPGGRQSRLAPADDLAPRRPQPALARATLPSASPARPEDPLDARNRLPVRSARGS